MSPVGAACSRMISHTDMNPSTTFEWLCYFLSFPQENNEAEVTSRLSLIKWDELLELAQKHGVSPLLYHQLKHQGFGENVPAKILSALQQCYLQNAARNMRLYHQLSTVLTALREHDIPVIVLKGAYLAEAIYGNIALRPMGDIDLLIKPADVAQANGCLTGLGYQASHPFWLESQQTFGVHLPTFVHPERIPIELHVRLVPPDSPFTYDIEELWRRAQPVNIAGCQAYGLAPEHLALYLCIHAAYGHNLAMGLQPLSDLTFLCETYQQTMDWEQLLGTARQWNAEKNLYLGLYFARKFFQAKVPDEIVQAIQPADVTTQWLDWLQAHLLNPGEQFPTHLVKLVGAKGIREKLAMVWKRMFLSPEEMGCLYNIAPTSPAIYLRYPHRIWGQVKRYGGTVWRLLRRDPELTSAADDKHAFREWLTTPKGRSHR